MLRLIPIYIKYPSFSFTGLAKYTGDKRFGATSVLILTYMRSGSSLTGDILQQATDSFYVYEPFWRVEHRDTRIDIITYVNGSRR